MNRKNLETALEFLDKLGSLMAEYEAELEVDESGCWYAGDKGDLVFRLLTKEKDRVFLDLNFGCIDMTIDDVLMQADKFRRYLEELE